MSLVLFKEGDSKDLSCYGKATCTMRKCLLLLKRISYNEWVCAIKRMFCISKECLVICRNFFYYKKECLIPITIILNLLRFNMIFNSTSQFFLHGAVIEKYYITTWSKILNVNLIIQSVLWKMQSFSNFKKKSFYLLNEAFFLKITVFLEISINSRSLWRNIK